MINFSIFNAVLDRRMKATATIFLALLLVLHSIVAGWAQESKKVRMAYSAFSIAFLNVFMARDAGLFKKYGVVVELIQMSGLFMVGSLEGIVVAYLCVY